MKTLHGLRVLLWAEEPADLIAVANILRRAGCELRWVPSLEHLESQVRNSVADLVVVRLYPAGPAPTEALRWIREVASPPGVLVACGPLDVRLYLDAMEAGAIDAVVMSPDEDEVIRVVSQALDTLKVRSGTGDFDRPVPGAPSIEVPAG